MSHFGDFMDGVPVKISERYKRPPRIELPYSVTECTTRAQNIAVDVRYDTTFENNVLAKLKELRSAKETKKNERRHRLQLIEEGKQKKLDAIAAAETEEKFKQLSISEVSYPSTEEISGLSSDDKPEKPEIATSERSPEQTELPNNEINFPSCSTDQPQLNILQPVQVQSHYQLNNLLDDPDPLQEFKLSTKITKMPQYNHNIDTLTFKDFENDTSNPFDNVELKTINDMELLAQVLQSQRESSTSCHTTQYVPEQTYTTVPNCASQAQMEGTMYLSNNYLEQPIQGSEMVYSSPHHYPVSNGYYVPNENVCDNIPVDNMNVYMPNYQYYVPTNQYPIQQNDFHQPLNNDIHSNQVQNGTPFVSQPYYYQYPQIQPQYLPPTAYNVPAPTQTIETNPSSLHMMKSRSRSVPDIVKELDEELASNKLRASERSYNASPAPNNPPRSTSSSDKNEDKRRKRKIEQLPNPYDKLPSKLQDMCRRIHTMGFPIDRVARVITLVGDNDKKIIEGLLVVGELLDLGFSEGRVSAALAKHDFNKDKALDDLVS